MRLPKSVTFPFNFIQILHLNFREKMVYIKIFHLRCSYVDHPLILSQSAGALDIPIAFLYRCNNPPL